MRQPSAAQGAGRRDRGRPTSAASRFCRHGPQRANTRIVVAHVGDHGLGAQLVHGKARDERRRRLVGGPSPAGCRRRRPSPRRSRTGFSLRRQQPGMHGRLLGSSSMSLLITPCSSFAASSPATRTTPRSSSNAIRLGWEGWSGWSWVASSLARPGFVLPRPTGKRAGLDRQAPAPRIAIAPPIGNGHPGACLPFQAHFAELPHSEQDSSLSFSWAAGVPIS